MKAHKNTPHPISRRKFIGSTALLTGSLWGLPQILRSQTLGDASQAAANSRLGMGFIGTGKISGGHLRSFPDMEGVQPIAVCDIRSWLREKAQQTLAEKGYPDIQSFADYQELLDNPAIDIVCIATPDHWHAAMAIDAMKAGKDVYLEKPMTLTIEEGKAVRKAAQKYNRIVQVGSQQRSSAHFRIAANLVRNGVIGEIKEIQCRLGSFPLPPEHQEIIPVPDGFDYDRWLGPTPFYEHTEHRVLADYNGGWRCYWDYGNRKFGDWGAHHFDIIQWALGRDDTGPVEFVPIGYEGAEFHHFRYADGLTVYRDKEADSESHDIRFIGSEGEVLVKRGKVFTRPTELIRVRFTEEESLQISDNHRQNFLDSVRSREAPICHPEVGHRSGTICSLAAIAEQIGRPVRWDPKGEQIIGDEAARRMQSRPRRKGYELPAV